MGLPCRAAIAALLGVLFCMGALPQARAEERIALVIGNGAYEDARSLDSPATDAELMANTLKKIGFEATLLIDADQNDMERAVSDFGQSLRTAGTDATGLFYYAGHGVQSGGRNYLLPVDVTIAVESDLDLYAIQTDWVLGRIRSARNRTNIVLLESGRASPFETLGSPGADGLAEISAPQGTFVASASEPGTAAPDGASGSPSPFTEALAREMLVENQPLERTFSKVRDAVRLATDDKQTPWQSSALDDEFVFRSAERDPGDEVARQHWETIKYLRDPVQAIVFLRNYPDSEVSDEARAFLIETLEPDPDEPRPDPVAEAGAKVSPTEADFFRRAQQSGSIDGYKAYLGTFPQAVFADFAYKEIAAQELWNALKQTADPVQVVVFLRSYPDSSVSTEARARLRELIDAEFEPRSSQRQTVAADGGSAVGGSRVGESEMFRRAQSSGAIDDYETYLAEYPEGVFVELALAEIQALKEQGATVTPGGAAQEAALSSDLAEQSAATPPPPEADLPDLPPEPVMFNAPLSRGIPQIDGRSIAQIIDGSPQYPPIKGLPDEVWKDKKCSNCHHWNQARLCEQGNTYLTDTGRFALDKEHPIDGFKQVLRDWAASGCK
jgi:uncharacterized caspase-like protein